MIRTLVGLTLLGLLVLAGYLFFYLGFYAPVEVRIEERGPLILVGKDHTGAYHGVGQSISAVERWAIEQNVPCPQTFGLFFDDPAAVDQDRLRSRGGCILMAKADGVEIPADFITDERPRARFVVGRFEGSPSISPFKVYPKIKEFVEEQRLKVPIEAMEIYTLNGADVITEVLFLIEQ
jgi:effector-binding domain-containing protein